MNPRPKEQLIFFLYARKSSESEDRQVQSIDDQIFRLTELARTQNLNIKEIFTEAKTSKKPYCRPVFTDMLARIEKGEANGILCWQLNRLSRNPIDSGNLSWMLQQGALKSIQTIDREYLPDDNVLLFNVETGMANQFIIDLRKNCKRGMEGKANRGWLPAPAPLGYLNDRLLRIIVEDPKRFALVRKMWDLMLTGNYTVPQIQEKANHEWNFRTPKNRRGMEDLLALSSLYKMFRNIFYTGMFRWGGKLYSGNHMPMITLDEYDRVQTLISRNEKTQAKTHEFAFTGIIRCGHCGAMYTASEKMKWVKKENAFKPYVYYHCTKKNKLPCIDSRPIRLDTLETQIEGELEQNTILPVFFAWALEKLELAKRTENTDRRKITEMQQASLAESQKEMDNLVRMYYRELIEEATYIKERALLKEKIAKLTARMNETENRSEKWIELTEKTFHFITYGRKEFTTGPLQRKREIFASLGSNFLLKDKKLIFQAADWLVPVTKAYPKLKAEYERLELDKTLSAQGRIGQMRSVDSTVVRHCRDC